MVQKKEIKEVVKSRWIGFQKGDHYYLLRWNVGYEPNILNAVMVYAKDSDCLIDYSDVVQIIQKIRDIMVKDLEKAKV